MRSYVVLYVLSPVLNAYVGQTSRRAFTGLLAGLLATVFLWGWITAGEYQYGYSVSSFIVLYLLGRYVRLYPCRWFTLPWWADLSVYGVCTLLTWLFQVAGSWLGTNRLGPSYVSPFTYVGATALLLCFSKLKFYHPWVNRIAASSFAVYVLHACTPFLPLTMRPLIQHFWHTSGGLAPFVALCAAWVVGLFAASMLIDQVRRAVWKWLEPKLLSVLP